ncbi:Phosphatidylinositol-4-phosphate 5-kinase, partial [Cladochytrium tenue]
MASSAIIANAPPLATSTPHINVDPDRPPVDLVPLPQQDDDPPTPVAAAAAVDCPPRPAVAGLPLKFLPPSQQDYVSATSSTTPLTQQHSAPAATTSSVRDDLTRAVRAGRHSPRSTPTKQLLPPQAVTPLPRRRWGSSTSSASSSSTAASSPSTSGTAEPPPPPQSAAGASSASDPASLVSAPSLATLSSVTSVAAGPTLLVREPDHDETVTMSTGAAATAAPVTKLTTYGLSPRRAASFPTVMLSSQDLTQSILAANSPQTTPTAPAASTWVPTSPQPVATAGPPPLMSRANSGHRASAHHLRSPQYGVEVGTLTRVVASVDANGSEVVVGTPVKEGHANYMLMYDMLTGIRVSVSRCNARPFRPLEDADFVAAHKLAFDVSGNEMNPSGHYDFKFKDYAPWMSLTGKYVLSERGSPGKSGSFFYYSQDYRFIIKTIHRSEHRFLRRILRNYYEHVLRNPDTLLTRVLGMHRVKLPGNRKIAFVVMGNVFPPDKD